MFIIDLRNKLVSEYRFSVINNSNVDKVHIISHFVEYANYSIYLKIRSVGGDYVDKIAIPSENISINEDTLVVKWTMGAVSTHCKRIEIQLQFEADENIIAQSRIATIVLNDTIDVDQLIPVIYPTIIKDMQDDIKKSYAGAEMSYANDTLTLVLKNKDGITKTSLQVAINTSDKYTKTESDNKYVAKVDTHNVVYGTDNSGAQTSFALDYGSTFTGNVVRRDSNNQIYVPLVPTANGHATSKSYVDSLIDEIEQRSDVVDVVGTYADLQAYDTTHLAPNSLIKVINDETHDNEITYYRWVITGGIGSWVYVASEGAYYTTSQIDTMLVGYYKKNEDIIPSADNSKDIGSSSYWFKDAYLKGTLYFSTNYLAKVDSGLWCLQYNGANVLTTDGSSIWCYKDIKPINENVNLGYPLAKFDNLYLKGKIFGENYNESLDDIYTTINNLNEASANTEIKWSKMLTFNKSADTTFTFETAKTNCLNEYKAIITNSGNADIVCTFTGVLHILCNDDACVVSNNTITIPSGVSLEINCLNNCLVAINFNAQ